MSLTIIVKEGSADRRRRIYERGNPLNGPIEGRTASVDEAHDIAYHEHGEPRGAFLVEGGPELHQTALTDATMAVRKAGSQADPADVVKQWESSS